MAIRKNRVRDIYRRPRSTYNIPDMPISKSAKKALNSSERKASLNRHRKELVKAATKKVTATTLPKAMSMVDKATKWGIFHKNKAARLKSRLTKLAGGTPKTSLKTKTETAKSPVKKTAKKSTKPKTAK